MVYAQKLCIWTQTKLLLNKEFKEGWNVDVYQVDMIIFTVCAIYKT